MVLEFMNSILDGLVNNSSFFKVWHKNFKFTLKITYQIIEFKFQKYWEFMIP